MELGHRLAIMVPCCWGGGGWAPSQDWGGTHSQWREGGQGWSPPFLGLIHALPMFPLVPSWGGEQGGKLGEHQ